MTETSIIKPSGRRKKSFFYSLRTRMLTSFGLLLVCALVGFEFAYVYGIPLTGYEGEYEKEQAEVFRELNLIADLKKERLLRWIEERNDDARVLAESTIVKSHVKRLHQMILEKRRLGKEYDVLWDELKGEKAYQDLLQH